MKKVTLLLLGIFLMAGCIDDKVKEGKDAILDEKYEEALESFESALEKSGDVSELEVLIKQTEKMLEAIHQQEVGNQMKAIALFEQVNIMEGGYDILSEEAKERREALQHEEQNKYNEQLTQAEKLKDNEEYEEAKMLLNEIIYKTDAFKYLEEQYKHAMEMFDEIEENMKVA